MYSSSSLLCALIRLESARAKWGKVQIMGRSVSVFKTPVLTHSEQCYANYFNTLHLTEWNCTCHWHSCRDQQSENQQATNSAHDYCCDFHLRSKPTQGTAKNRHTTAAASHDVRQLLLPTSSIDDNQHNTVSSLKNVYYSSNTTRPTTHASSLARM